MLFSCGSTESSEWTRKISAVDLACALVLFKRRFRLSISCMNHLLKLLPHIPQNISPTSWSALKTLLRNSVVLSPTVTTFLCSKCREPTSSSLLCSACGVTIDPVPSLLSFQNFNISDQLHRIVATNHRFMELDKRSDEESMRDVRDGAIHQRIQQQCSDAFITLTLNIDGIQPNQGSNKSIWPMLLVVNELPIAHRFSPANMILAGIWPGPTKPSRAEMAFFMRPLVAELVRLERGEVFFVPSSSSSSFPQMMLIRVYLIGACCDKPAQALVQNIPEPIAAFGCGRCEIEGTHRTGDKAPFLQS